MKKIILILLSMAPVVGFAQPLIYGKAVVGNYAMGDMKDFLKELQQDLTAQGISAKTVTSFPVSLQAEVGLDFTVHDVLLREYKIGGFMNYAMTRARISYADYSGSADIVNDLMRVNVGVRGVFDATGDFSLYGKMGLCYSDLDIISKNTLNGAGSDEDELNFTALGLTLEPGIQWNRHFKRFVLMANFGYEININGKTMYDDESWLIDAEENVVKLDWSGFRLGAGVGFSF